MQNRIIFKAPNWRGKVCHAAHPYDAPEAGQSLSRTSRSLPIPFLARRAEPVAMATGFQRKIMGGITDNQAEIYQEITDQMIANINDRRPGVTRWKTTMI